MSREKILEEKILKITIAMYKVASVLPEYNLSNEFRKLANKIYDLSLRILFNNLSLDERRNFFYDINNELNILFRFFEITKNFNFLREENFEILTEEYSSFFQSLKELLIEYESQRSFFNNLFVSDLEISKPLDSVVVNDSRNNDDLKEEEQNYSINFQNNSVEESNVCKESEFKNDKITPFRINKRHEKIIEKLKNSQGGLRRQDLIEKLNFLGSPRSFSRDLEFLCKKGLIERKGDKKGTIYYIPDR